MAERLPRRVSAEFRIGRYCFEDVMDSDGQAASACAIKVEITVADAAGAG